MALKKDFSVRLLRCIQALVLLALSPVAAAEVIRFAPLPMASLEQMTREYLPFLDYLEQQTGQQFELAYHSSYSDLLDALTSGEVQLAYLGPLPYVAVTERTESLQPLVQWLDSEGSSDYTCALVHFAADKRSNIHSIEKPHSIALTQPLSTCGYLVTETHMRAQGYSLEDAFHTYDYTGSHEQVALSVILGRHEHGTLRSKIARQYHHLGLRIFAETPPLPGFVLVGNTQRLSPAVLQQIRSSLLNLKPLQDPAAAEIVKSWSSNLRYGAVEVDDSAYDPVRQQWRQLKVDLIGAEQ